ncbi:hypothetical protein QA644_08170 [Rhizobium sp. CC1099]|uniref:hypothetical protein n=1 Tax=Rhizobium sp. CC1099 TaxID=3039160 RepID=UPI0024B0CB80|nr:hypothetical protein [Rhizobium sp. CC1099]WFU89005.1 hypothetical protein QA644_08170 [Rhizobium sp. CC1099]
MAAPSKSMLGDEPADFAEALRYQIRNHDETTWSLLHAMSDAGHRIAFVTLRRWVLGKGQPGKAHTFKALEFVEDRYELPRGYFLRRIGKPTAPYGARQGQAYQGNLHEIAWHLPSDFFFLPAEKREEIVDWVRRSILRGSTDFNAYQRTRSKTPYSIKFENPFVTEHEGRSLVHWRWMGKRRFAATLTRTHGVIAAPPRLAEEIKDLALFKTSTFTRTGFRRSGVWTEFSMLMSIQRLGRIFGALAASPGGELNGHGVPLPQLTMGILAFSSVWDWYLWWCQERRGGLLTLGEVTLMGTAVCLLQPKTGWLTQRPDLGAFLTPIPGLISVEDVERAKGDWPATCERSFTEIVKRRADVNRVARRHRNPFEAVLPVLNADSPLKEYLKIADEIERRVPDLNDRPRSAAVAVRSLLMIRLALVLGFRSKNLRELLVRMPGQNPRGETELEEGQRGELRWNESKRAWEVFVPTVAFKNYKSKFFEGSPFEMTLADRGNLYLYINEYVRKHRPYLLGGQNDPGTFFVRWLDRRPGNAEFTQSTFYDAWRLIVQRYGIYNPYTDRGAIKGLLPHGPHCARHVLAVHILKTTGSVEYASYVIHDVPRTILAYYARFLPKDKSAIASKILDQVWEDKPEFDFRAASEGVVKATTFDGRYHRRR